jgi:hypothetical protein
MVGDTIYIASQSVFLNLEADGTVRRIQWTTALICYSNRIIVDKFLDKI